ncbi:MAG TPA: DsbA family protein [Alphaproteobacteria bacterium]|nr:DsbA family protein [Alphaproteobacteria bacterium]
MKRLMLLVALLLPAVLTSAQNSASTKQPATVETKLPTTAEVDAVLKRVYGYDPSIQWKVFLVRQSPIPGMSEVLLKIKDDYHHLYLTADGHFAIDGEMQPFGPDPYAIIRERLNAAEGVAHGPARPVTTMVEFSDLQCPHCKEAQPVLEKLAADFPSMRIIFQQYPIPSLHPWAMKAAQYADCAGRMDSGAAWKFIADIYENQSGIALATADEKLKELATAAGLDAGKLSSCAANPTTEARVKKSLELGNSVGVMGTPTIFVNGRQLEGVVGIPYEQVKAIVQYEIDHAGK